MAARARRRPGRGPRRPRGSGTADRGTPTDDVLDGHAAYREELVKLGRAGDRVPDVGPDPLAADPAQLVVGPHGFRPDDVRFLAAGLDMLRREHEED